MRERSTQKNRTTTAAFTLVAVGSPAFLNRIRDFPSLSYGRFGFVVMSEADAAIHALFRRAVWCDAPRLPLNKNRNPVY